jgi:hypothetical protein
MIMSHLLLLWWLRYEQSKMKNAPYGDGFGWIFTVASVTVRAGSSKNFRSTLGSADMS